MAEKPKVTDILDMSDAELIQRGIMRTRETMPAQAWMFFALSIGLFCAAGAWLIWGTGPDVIKGAIGFVVGGLFFAVLSAFTSLMRVLFIMHRQQLEIRILATDLPNAAAGIIVKHMTPKGL
jgi:hypothetical protein